ncbi:hypothetical protein ACGF0D_29550 [Kitasatospora sp. NPDC048298]|uniref:hypothetical protein n=1 Tax=Kitasatospora sp. NPDC048298 TaxID=3364049 RepID=UPI00371E0BB8
MNTAAAWAGTLVNPAPSDLLFSPHRIRPGTSPEAWPRFGQLRWNLAYADHSQITKYYSVNWANVPEAFRGSLMRAGWAVVNIPTPDFLLDKKRGAVPSVHPGTLQAVFRGWKEFALWLDSEGITSLAEVTRELMESFALTLPSKGRSWPENQRHLSSLARLWAYAPYLLPQDRIPMPPWEDEGASHADYLGERASTGGEASTPVIHPAVMSPLLVWAIRMVTDLAPDILAAVRERERLLARAAPSAVKSGRATIRDHLRQLVDGGQKIPTDARRKIDPTPRAGRLPIAAQYLAGLLEVAPTQVSSFVRDRPEEFPPHLFGVGAPLDLPITAKIGDRPWTEKIDFGQVPDLAICLAAAATVVIIYLSGMRPEEALHLERGCRSTEEREDGTVRYKITGRHFSGVRDKDGNTQVGGEIREDPWIVIEPVHQAVAVLEELTDERFLLPHSLTTKPKPVEIPLPVASQDMVTAWIAKFIAWANEQSQLHDRPHEFIPEDPDGAVVLVRFRRTVAWFVYHRPGGRIALGVQYGHVETTMGESYAGRSKADMLQILNFEQGLAMADSLAEASERLASGEGVSGAAAERYLAAVSEYGNKFAGAFVTTRQLKAIRRNPKLQVFEHERSLLACNFDPYTALCQRERPGQEPAQRTPSHDRCQAACPNIARTDTHIERAKAEITDIDAECAEGLNPLPITRRLEQRRATLAEIIDKHERTRIYPAPTTGDRT